MLTDAKGTSVSPPPARTEGRDGGATRGAAGFESPRPANPETYAAVYLRVSTQDQDLVGQERELADEAGRRGWGVSARYAEKVSATGKVERKEYEKLLRDASSPERRWSHVLVWSLDRFSREATFTKATQAVLDLEKLGVSFHSLKEPTLDTPEDGRPNLGRDVLLALLPVIAAFESKRRSERVPVAMGEIKAGRRRTRSGRPRGDHDGLRPNWLRGYATFVLEVSRGR